MRDLTALHQIREALKNAGYKILVYAKEGEEEPTWFFYGDDKNIGYAQAGDYGGVRFSTVHKPCRECGTGFGLQSWDEAIFDPTIKDALKAFISYPNWAKPNDRKAVVKYANIEEYATKENTLKYTFI